MRIVAVAFCLPLVLGPSARVADATDSEDLSSQSERLDPIWTISTRHLGYAGNELSAGELDLQVLRYDAASEVWLDAPLQAFLDEDGEAPTVFYVHGNRRDRNEAFRRGWACYHALARDAGPDLPFRFVIWSWPSDQLRGPLRDIRAKACRTNVDGQYLGWLLGRMQPDTRVSLVGYSFGARIITGAMHLLNGGTLAGQTVPIDSPAARTPVRAVLLAAAIHSDWLLPGRPHEDIWPVTDRMSVLYNSSDPVLRRYHAIERRGRPQALGYVGFWGWQQLGAAAKRVSNRDVSCYVGRTHDVDAYFCSSTVMNWVRETTLGAPVNDRLPLATGESMEIDTDLAAGAIQK